MFQNLRRWWLPIVVGVVVALPSLSIGFVLDDWVLIGGARGDFVVGDGPLDLFSFATGDPARTTPFIVRGPYPWFTDPAFRIHFFRPVSSALAVFDLNVFGDQAWLAHLHSIAWYALLIFVVGKLNGRWFGLATSILIGVLFAIDDGHAMPTHWLSNRNSLVSVTLAWTALWLHIRWREDKSRFSLAGAVAIIIVALGAGETTVSALAYIVAYELFGRKADPLSQRIRALIPLALVMVAYLAMYKRDHYGAANSGSYVDPIQEPAAFLVEAPRRFAAMLASWTFGITADLWLLAPVLRPLMIGGGVIAAGVWLLVWRRAHAKHEHADTLRWLAAGGVMSMIPGLATFPTDRLFIAPSLGLCAIAAIAIEWAWARRGQSKLALVWVGWAFIGQPMTNWVAGPILLRSWGQITTQAVVSRPRTTNRPLILICGDFVPAIYGIPLLAYEKQPLPDTWQVVSMTPSAHKLTRVDERSIDVEVIDARMIESVFEQNVRKPTKPFAVGDRVQLDGASVEVMSVSDGLPTRVRTHLELPLEAYTFLVWRGDGFREIELPAVGTSRSFERAPTIPELVLQPGITLPEIPRRDPAASFHPPLPPDRAIPVVRSQE